MNFFRRHWYDIGGVLALIIGMGLYINRFSLTNYQWLMWCSLISLFLHQLEEYRVVGTFPGMVNRVMFRSEIPDRYPLNTNTSVYVNVFVGWTIYFLAAILAEKAIWLGIATLLVSAGNIIAHTLVFNLKGKSFYNAGLATSWLFFAPCIFFFCKIVQTEQLITITDLVIGLPLGIALNVIGILKMITWFADKTTPYVFEQRNLLRRDRK